MCSGCGLAMQLCKFDAIEQIKAGEYAKTAKKIIMIVSVGGPGVPFLPAVLYPWKLAVCAGYSLKNYLRYTAWPRRQRYCYLCALPAR